MCGTCLRFSINERPACVRCAYEASTRPQRRLSLAVVFPSFAAGAGFWLVRRYDLWPDQAASLAFAAVVVLLIAGLVGSTARSARGKEVRYREEEEEPQYVEDPMQGAGNPYRAGARRVLLAVSPRVSGKLTALVVLASLVGASILVPASVRLPRWIEAEMVLGLWWLVMAVTLVVLLYRGFRLNDDLVVFMPWDRPQASKRGGATTEKSSMSRAGRGAGAGRRAGSGVGHGRGGDAAGVPPHVLAPDARHPSRGARPPRLRRGHRQVARLGSLLGHSLHLAPGRPRLRRPPHAPLSV
jgi:hypothetical protein